ncbi:hypothetical protein ACIRPH_09550 [Nocardiopsis sp. NPDC101807]|uniref:hypothetical protein n=1 Tax=Nocardiopsis sp. NPDC101807 TaxID=3364339 RepID=UPI00380BFF49
MSPVQIVRTVAFALIAGGVALGLVPGGSCGAGWWPLVDMDASFGWFAYEEVSRPGTGMGAGLCGTTMAPVGSWAVALVVVGATLLLGAWITTPYGPQGRPEGTGARPPEADPS